MLVLALYWPMRGLQSGDEVLHWLHQTTLFCSSFYGIGVIILRFPDPPMTPLTLMGTDRHWPGEPGGGRQTSVSITGQYSVLFRLLQNYECKWGILDSREGGRTQIGCDAPFWVDWINNWWLHIYSHWVIRALSSFCDKSWLFESNIKLNGDLLVSKLRPDLVVILTVISFIPLSQILMHIQVSS